MKKGKIISKSNRNKHLDKRFVNWIVIIAVLIIALAVSVYIRYGMTGKAISVTGNAIGDMCFPLIGGCGNVYYSNNFCENGNVYRNWITPYCSLLFSCTEISEKELIRNCDASLGCSNGECNERAETTTTGITSSAGASATSATGSTGSISGGNAGALTTGGGNPDVPVLSSIITFNTMNVYPVNYMGFYGNKFAYTLTESNKYVLYSYDFSNNQNNRLFEFNSGNQFPEFDFINDNRILGNYIRNFPPTGIHLCNFDFSSNQVNCFDSVTFTNIRRGRFGVSENNNKAIYMKCNPSGNTCIFDWLCIPNWDCKLIRSDFSGENKETLKTFNTEGMEAVGDRLFYENKIIFYNMYARAEGVNGIRTQKIYSYDYSTNQETLIKENNFDNIHQFIGVYNNKLYLIRPICPVGSLECNYEYSIIDLSNNHEENINTNIYYSKFYNNFWLGAKKSTENSNIIREFYYLDLNTNQEHKIILQDAVDYASSFQTGQMGVLDAKNGKISVLVSFGQNSPSGALAPKVFIYDISSLMCNQCGDGQSCVNGQCVANSGGTLDPCLNVVCSPGQTCSNGQCIPNVVIYSGDNIGYYVPTSATFNLKNPDSSFVFGSSINWIPVAGDWNGQNGATIGLYDPSTSVFYLKNSNSAGYADLTFGYGSPGASWKPITGNWDGTGGDSIGLYDPSSSMFYLRNSNSAGIADISFGFGAPNARWKPIAGHWDSSMTGDSVGLYNPSSGTFYLRKTKDTGIADISFTFNPIYPNNPDSNWIPVAGDWDNDGIDGVGLFNPSTGTFYLKNSNIDGNNANIIINNAISDLNAKPIAGHWQI